MKVEEKVKGNSKCKYVNIQQMEEREEKGLGVVKINLADEDKESWKYFYFSYF